MTRIPTLDEPVKKLMRLDQCSVFALADIAAERVRQIEVEGWDVEHDGRYEQGELERAASSYAYSASRNPLLSHTPAAAFLFAKRLWPWDMKWFKPKSPHRDNVRAGALLVAALSRQLRRGRANG